MSNDEDISSPFQLWWKRNSDVVRHVLEGGCFLPKNETQKEIPPSLERFEEVYARDATYHDLFVVARGREAVRYSFQLIGTFWQIRLLQQGPPQHLLPNSVSTRTGSVVRIPYTLAQRPKHLPLWLGGWYQYQGWIDLHLMESSSKPFPTWQVSHHVDRMGSHGEKEESDILSHLQGMPLVAPLWISFRWQHGSLVEHGARRAYKRD